jgi:hypothetical protein
MGEKMNSCKIFMGNQSERDHCKDHDVSGRIILKWILESYDGMAWAGMIWPSIGASGCLF